MNKAEELLDLMSERVDPKQVRKLAKKFNSPAGPKKEKDGSISIDTAGMSNKDKKGLMSAMQKLFASDSGFRVNFGANDSIEAKAQKISGPRGD